MSLVVLVLVQALVLVLWSMLHLISFLPWLLITLLNWR